MRHDLDQFYDLVFHIMKTRDMCRATKSVMFLKKCDDDFTFTINDLVIGTSGCHQCKATYPSLNFNGVMTHHNEESKYNANLSTYDFFRCKCPDSVPQKSHELKDEPPACMIFKFYKNDEVGEWINGFIDLKNLKRKFPKN